jgi:hypothetical protein
MKAIMPTKKVIVKASNAFIPSQQQGEKQQNMRAAQAAAANALPAKKKQCAMDDQVLLIYFLDIA